MALLCNDVSHWLGASLESALNDLVGRCLMKHIYASINWVMFGNGLSPVRAMLLPKLIMTLSIGPFGIGMYFSSGI